jgi:hypothetical protein
MRLYTQVVRRASLKRSKAMAHCVGTYMFTGISTCHAHMHVMFHYMYTCYIHTFNDEPPHYACAFFGIHMCFLWDIHGCANWDAAVLQPGGMASGARACRTTRHAWRWASRTTSAASVSRCVLHFCVYGCVKSTNFAGGEQVCPWCRVCVCTPQCTAQIQQ